ncbi:hypothetical protein D9757_006259 [Collybiopsis confluens]|uniref:C2H2-type domain-containing protein n=1 Tax=Collybiopsis confluens TaxID=2823264 RepID=A0A8H5HJN3_9AGAR|nr:hypothetical protein D9757_009517 [Collybiopsis confluens]KAF5384751.1 hypothetical protein D9757_006259 [Collybiopsis confluens]
MTMAYTCAVCGREFSTQGNRKKHIQNKKDNGHREYLRKEADARAAQYSRTFNPPSQPTTSTTSPPSSTTGSGVASFSAVQELPAESSDVEMLDDLPLSYDGMEVDDEGTASSDHYDDDDSEMSDDQDLGGLISAPDYDSERGEENDLLDKFEEDNAVLERIWNEELQKIAESGSVANPFNFLPDPEEGASGTGDSKSEADDSTMMKSEEDYSVSNSEDDGLIDGATRKLDRSLTKDDDDEPRSWRWHPTAGQILRHEPGIFQRWEELFSEIKVEEGSSRKSVGYHPFTSRVDWEVAQWAIKEKVSQKSFDRLLQIPEIKERLGLSYNNSRSMLKLIDVIPDRCGQWYTKQLSFRDQPNETFIIHHRDPIKAIKGLWGDPAFVNHLVYKPANLFCGSKQTEEERVFSEMWTADFWNSVQMCIPKGGTVCPVIIATDKTQLTQFSGSKVAYPVYLTIGNIPKSLRRQPSSRACVLIAYLSVDKPQSSGGDSKSKKKLSKTALKMKNYELFHCSMAHVLEPLKKAGNASGNGIEMVGGDGAVRRVYPLLAAYAADYPEQCLITCTKSGTCPKCRRKAKELELPNSGDLKTPLWTVSVIKEARIQANDSRKKVGNIHKYAMKHYDVAAGTFDPFWAGFPLADIHRCIAPDILHQCYQGVFKHLVKWIQSIVGEKELDRRLQMLPPSSGVHYFKNGISGLTQLSGAEHKQIARVFLASLVGKVSPQGIKACRSLLHFIYLAQYPIHDQETLKYMVKELKTWNINRSYFVEHGVRSDFNIPKFHSLTHYVASIRWLGTTDNYNTEMFERLHIDFAKEGWRASNKRDHFPQMVQWLSRQEKVAYFDYYQSWSDSTNTLEDLALDLNDPVAVSDANTMVVTCESSSSAGNLTHEECDSFKLESFQTGRDVNSRASTRASSSGTARRSKKTLLLAQPNDLSETNIQIAKFSHEPRKSLARIARSHGAPSFILQLKVYLNSLLPSSQQASSQADLLQGSLPFTSLDIWHHFKFMPFNLFDDKSDVTKETVKAAPAWRKNSVSRYDTVIVLETDKAGATAVIGCRVARLKVIFCLPKVVNLISGLKIAAPSNWPTTPLAYVEWFTQFDKKPDPVTEMYQVKPILPDSASTTGRNSCMLVPSKEEWDMGWTSENILDKCSSFHVNNLQNWFMLPVFYTSGCLCTQAPIRCYTLHKHASRTSHNAEREGRVEKTKYARRLCDSLARVPVTLHLLPIMGKRRGSATAQAPVSTRSSSRRGSNNSPAVLANHATDPPTRKPTRKRKLVEPDNLLPSEDIQEYVPTLLHTGQSADVKGTKRSRGSKVDATLNADGIAFLNGIGVTPPVRPIGGNVSEVDVSDDESGEDDSDDDTTRGDDLIVQDISKNKGLQGLKTKEIRGKILKTDFDSPRLASFTRLCTRKAVCLLNIFPETSSFAWPIVHEEINRLKAEGKGQELDEELKMVEKNPLEMEKLEKYMFYSTSNVRYDFAQHADAANWLIANQKFHHGKVYLEARTTNNAPFRSPLVPMILRGYLIESRPNLDQLLVKHLHLIQRIPVHLIVMIAVLIHHSLSEYTSGTKTNNHLSGANLGRSYRVITKTMDGLVQNSPTYVDLLECDLYTEMMTAGPEIVPPETYDYSALEKQARTELEGKAVTSAAGHRPEGNAAGSSKKRKTSKKDNAITYASTSSNQSRPSNSSTPLFVDGSESDIQSVRGGSDGNGGDGNDGGSDYYNMWISLWSVNNQSRIV